MPFLGAWEYICRAMSRQPARYGSKTLAFGLKPRGVGIKIIKQGSRSQSPPVKSSRVFECVLLSP